jgi:hypothetical protein
MNRKLRFILSWQTYSVGDVIEPNATLRDWLIANGYCVPVSTQTVAPANRAVLGLPNKRSAR